MALVRWEPFKDLERFFEEDWDLFPIIPLRGVRIPEVDVYEEKGNIVVETSLPGIKPDEIDVSLEDKTLRIKGEKKETKEEKKRNYFRKEVKKGAFERVITLPVEVKAKEAKAEMKDGILKITLPKVEKEKAKAIKVKVK